MARLLDDGYRYDDCHICGLGERPGIHWVDYERDYHQSTGMRHLLLICSSCLGEGLVALATLVKDEDGSDDSGVDNSLSRASVGAS